MKQRKNIAIVALMRITLARQLLVKLLAMLRDGNNIALSRSFLISVECL
jgi:hypothetical protein